MSRPTNYERFYRLLKEVNLRDYDPRFVAYMISNDSGSYSAKEIVSATGMARQYVSQSGIYAEKKGMIKRKPLPSKKVGNKGLGHRLIVSKREALEIALEGPTEELKKREAAIETLLEMLPKK
jgi:hypothetical protein